MRQNTIKHGCAMHRWAAAAGAAVGLSSALAFWLARSAEEATTAIAPRLVLPQYALDLGAGKPREVLRGSFIIENPGDAPLKFSICKNCNCTEIRPAKGVVAPGRGQEIRLGLRLPEVAGHGRHVRLDIYSNDAPRAHLTYEVLAQCPAPLRAEPEAIAFGTVEQGESPVVELAMFDQQDTPLTSGEGLDIDSSDLPVRVERRATPAGTLALAVVVPPDCPRGMLHGSIHVTRAESHDSVTVPVSGYVTGAIVIAPPTVSISRSGRLFSVVLARPGKENLPDVIEVTCPLGIAFNGRTGQGRSSVFRFAVQDFNVVPRGGQIVFAIPNREPAVVDISVERAPKDFDENTRSTGSEKSEGQLRGSPKVSDSASASKKP